MSLARELKREGLLVIIFQWWTIPELAQYFKESERGHAAAMETSLIAFLYPDLVNLEKAVDEQPRSILGNLPVYFPGDTKDYTVSGVFGVSSTANLARGEKVFEIVLAKIVGIIEKLKSINVKDLCSRD